MPTSDRPYPGTALAPSGPTTESRELAIERLSAAFATGAIDTEEFERRVTIAHRSGSLQEIQALLGDLPVGTQAPSLTRELIPPDQAPPRARTLSILGSTRRAGRWSVPRQMEVRSYFGNVELDYRNAVLPAGEIVLDLKAVFGNIEITVPPHLAVAAEGNAVLGNFDHVDRAPAQHSADAPVLRITGTSVFGNVEITMRLNDDHPRLPGGARPALPSRRG
jgi:hypothetical protein